MSVGRRRTLRLGRAAPTYKRGFGFHPLGGWLDHGEGTGEALSAMLRPGNAGANTADDHIDVFETALWQLEGLVPDSVHLVARADTAGCTHAFLDYLRQAGVGFSVGHPIDAHVRQAIRGLDADAWVPATRQTGDLRDGAAVGEITGHLDLSAARPGRWLRTSTATWAGCMATTSARSLA